MWRRPACQTLSKTLDISSATARVALDLLKALAILLDAAVIKSKIFEDFSSYRKKTNRVVVFSSGLSPNILKYIGHRWDHSTIWKARLLQTHIEEFRLLFMKVHTRSCLEPWVKCNQDQMLSTNQGLFWPF